MGNCAELPFPATRMVHRRRPYRRRNHTRHTYRRFCAPGRPEACEVGRRGDRRPRAGYEGGFAMWSPTGVTQKTAVVKPVYVTFSRGPGPPPATTTTAGPSRASHPPHTTGGGRPGYFSGSPVIHRLNRESTPVRGGDVVGAGVGRGRTLQDDTKPAGGHQFGRPKKCEFRGKKHPRSDCFRGHKTIPGGITRGRERSPVIRPL
jgi:hypothetical protein